jgi:hypothetical protein
MEGGEREEKEFFGYGALLSLVDRCGLHLRSREEELLLTAPA